MSFSLLVGRYCVDVVRSDSVWTLRTAAGHVHAVSDRTQLLDILFFCLFGRFDTANIPTLDISFVSFALPYRGLDST